METIKCPVCGEENDASLGNCQYCHQPLRQSTSELNGIGTLIDSGQTPTIKKTSELESTLPAWLKNARQGDRDVAAPESPPSTPASPSPIEESAPADAEPSPLEDWLSGLDDDEDEDEEAADWLMNLQGGATPESKKAPANLPAADEPITAGDKPRPSDEEEVPIGTGELPSWVSDLQGKSSSEESESLPDLFVEKETPQEDIVDAGDAESGELPDWLASLSQSSDSPPAPAETPSFEPVSPLQADSDSPDIAADKPVPDWMAGLQDSSFTETAAEEPVPAPEIPVDDLPDWISGSGSAAPVATESLGTESDLPDWMTSDVKNVAEEPASESLPDWISGSNESSSAPVAEPTEAPLSTEDNLDDWMANLNAAEEESASAMTETPVDEEISAGGDLPDWMAELKPAEESAPAMEESPAEEEISAGGDLPDWMAELKSAEESASVEAESETPVEGDMPDWLSSLPSAEDGKEEASLLGDAFEEQASVQAFDAKVPSTEEAEKADVPDWLSQLEPSASDSLVEEKAEAPAFAESADTPDWLEEMPAIETSGVETAPSVDASDSFSAEPEADNDEIFGIEMPDWLSTLGPEDADDEESAEVVPAHAGGEVSGVELPSWVQAMRPVADVVPDSSRPSDEQVAGTGPLAGLSGVLPAATDLGQINSPKANAIKLRVSESQQSSAAMLEELLASESQPSSFRTSVKTSSVPIVRWLIAILLFLAVGSSLFIRSEMVPSPNIENMEVPEIRDVINNINEFPTEKSVLLIFDYEAGFSGEMKAVAAPLVEQLMSRGAKLVVISTSPTGPALAENFLDETQAKYDFQPGVNYRNLGYLPGGASGMLSFIANPRLAILAKEEGDSVWGVAPLENITRFADFGLVIILTNDVEKGRAWVEQGAAILNDADTPLLMAISAQAEPILYPYYLSGQVDGLVSGLLGGATYEQMLSQRGLGRKYWDSYSIGLLLAEILIVIGAMINFLAALRARQKRQKEEN